MPETDLAHDDVFTFYREKIVLLTPKFNLILRFNAKANLWINFLTKIGFDWGGGGGQRLKLIS